MTHRNQEDPSGDRRRLMLAALEYGVSPLVAREAAASVALDRDETVDLGSEFELVDNDAYWMGAGTEERDHNGERGIA